MKLNKQITIKSGLIKKSEKWRGNIIIDSKLVIAKGAVVQVEPGTIIKFKGQNVEFDENIEKIKFLSSEFNASEHEYNKQPCIVVYGCFFVCGKIDNRVGIGNGSWNGYIYIAHGGSCSLKYANIRYSFGLIFDEYSKISKIDLCLFEQCFFGVANFSKTIIKNCEFRFNAHAIVSYSRAIIRKNLFYENIHNAVVFKSASRSYLFYNSMLLNNNAMTFLDSEDIVVKETLQYFNITGISTSNCLNSRILNCYVIDNLTGLKLNENSQKIFIENCFYITSPVYLSDGSQAEIQNSFIINCECGLAAEGVAAAFIFNSKIINNKINFMLSDLSSVRIKESVSSSFSANVLLSDAADFFADKSKLDSINFINISSEHSCFNLQASEVQCQYFAKINSLAEIFLKDNRINARNFIEMFDYSRIFILKNNIKIFDLGFLTRYKNYISIEQSNIAAGNNSLLNLNYGETVIINRSNISGNFAGSIRDGELVINDSAVDNKYGTVEFANSVKLNIENTKFDTNISGNGFSIINFKNSQTGSLFTSGYSCINLHKSSVNSNRIIIKNDSQIVLDDNYVNTESIKIKENGELLIQKANIDINETVKISGGGKFRIRGSAVESDRTCINKDGYEILECRDSELRGENGLVFIEGDSNIIDGVKIYSRDNGILLNGESEAELKRVEITSEETGIRYDGERREKIEGIKIKAREAVSIGGGELEVIGSEIEGEIRGSGSERIELIGSKVGTVGVRNLSSMKVSGSEISGREIEVSLNGELDISGSKIKLEDGIVTNGGGKFRIRGSAVESGRTCINKDGYEILECRDSELRGENGLVFIEGDSNIIDGVKIYSRDNGILLNGESEADLKRVEITSEETGIRYDGERIEKLESIKIKAREAVSIGGGELEVTGSEIEGEIRGSGSERIELRGSKVGTVGVRNLSSMKVSGSEISGREIEVSLNGELDISSSKIKLDEGIVTNGGGKFRIRGSAVESGRTCINKDGYEILECRDSELRGENGLVFIEGDSNIIDGVKIYSRDNGILLNGESEADLKRVEITSEETGIRYDGERREKIEGIKIKAREAVSIGGGELEVTGSEIEGEIRGSGSERIELIGSKVGTVGVRNLSSMKVSGSEISGREIEVSLNGELDISSSKIKLDEGIVTNDGGKFRIRGSVVESGRTCINKDGYEILECRDSELRGENGLVFIEGDSNIIDGVKIYSRDNGILLNGESEAELKRVEITSEETGIRYDGERREKIEGIKIKAREAVSIGGGELEVIGSEIEGEIRGSGSERIELIGSKVGTVGVRNLSSMKVSGSEISGREIEVSLNGELDISSSKIKLDEGIVTNDGGKFRIRGSVVESGRTCINKDGYEILECRDSELRGENGLVFIEGDSNIIDGVKIYSRDNGILLNGESEADLKRVEITSEETGIRYEGERIEKLESIKIKAREAVSIGGGELEVTGSEIEGEIRGSGSERIELIGSKVGTVGVRNLSSMKVSGSEISGREIEVSLNGELDISSSKIKLDEGIVTNGGGKFRIRGSAVESGRTCINKDGYEILECRDSELRGENGLVFIEGDSNIIDGVKIYSRDNGILLNGESEADLKRVEITSEETGIRYEGERIEKLESIKIKAREAVSIGGGELEVTGSEIEGEIRGSGSERIELRGSKVGTVGVRNLSSMKVSGSEISGREIEVSLNGELDISSSKIKLDEGIVTNDGGKFRIRGSVVESGRTCINKDGYEILECRDSELRGENGLVFIEGDSNIIDGVKIYSRDNGILLNGESEAELKRVEITSEETGIRYDGERREKIEGIKIKAREAVSIGGGELEVIGSEIEGEIRGSGSERIELIGSKVGTVGVRNLSSMKVSGSEISGREIEVSLNGELDISSSKIKLDEGIVTNDGGKFRIRGSVVESGRTCINKDGYEILECRDSELRGENGLVFIEGDSNIIDGVKIYSRDNGILLNGESEAELKRVEITSEETGIRYDGERREKIEGIKIKAREAVSIGGGELEVIGSEIEGEIRGSGSERIELIGSKVGTVGVRNLSSMKVSGSEISGREIEVSLNGELDISSSKIKLDEGIVTNDGGKFRIRGSVVESGRTCINKDGYEILECRDSELRGENGLVFIEGDSNIIDGVKIYSRDNGILLNGESEADLKRVEITSEETGIRYEGERIEKLESIKIKAREAVSIGGGELEVTDSDLEGIIIMKAESSFLVDNSNIDSFSMSGLSSAEIRNSAIKADVISVSQCAQLDIQSAEFDCEEGIQISGAGKVSISDSHIKSEKTGIKKEGTEDLYLINTKIVSSYESLSVFGDIFVKISDCSLKSYSKYAALFIGNAIVDGFGLHFSGNKGLFCSDLSLFTVSNFSIDVFSNSIRMTNSNLKADKFIFKSKLPDENLFVEGNSELILNKGKINIGSALQLNRTDKSALMIVTGNARVVLNKITAETILDNSINFISSSNKADICMSYMKTSGFYSFIKAADFSKIFINKSNIESKTLSFLLDGNSETLVQNTSLKSNDGFEYVLKEAARLFVKKIKNVCDSCFDLRQYSQVYSDTSSFIVRNESISASEFTLFNETRSSWKNYIAHGNDSLYKLKKNILFKPNEIIRMVLNLLQIAVIKTRNNSFLRKIYDAIYHSSVKIYPFMIKNDSISSIFLRRGMLNKDWIAGSSDIDFFTVIKNKEPYSEINLLYEIHKKYGKLKKIFPFYGENIIMTSEEVSFYIKYGDLRVSDIYNSKCLYGDLQFIKPDKNNYSPLKENIDKISEILNSYILLSANYFKQDSIVNDIGFAKASIDILKNISTDTIFSDSRTGWLTQYFDRCQNIEKNILHPLMLLLKQNIRISLDERNAVFNLIFNKINDYSGHSNAFIASNAGVNLIKVKKNHNLNNKHLTNTIDLLQKMFNNSISSIIIDAPGVCKVIVKEDCCKNGEIRNFNDIYKNIKQLDLSNNTPVLFFTESMFQMLLFARFKSMPLEEYRLKSFSNIYRKRVFFLAEDNQYFIHGCDMRKNLLLESLAEISFQINMLDVTKNFDSLRENILEILFNLTELNLYLKNDIITNDIRNMYNSFKMFNPDDSDQKELACVLNVFNDGLMPDKEKIIKIILFIKKVKNGLMKEFFDERKDKIK